jgi:thioredoxin reductase (NADPH)
MTIRKFYKDKKRVDKDWKGSKVDLYGNVIFMDGTKESTLDLFDEMIEKHNIDARFNTNIESIKKDKTKGLFLINTANNETFRARFVVIAIGNMGKPNKPKYALPSTLKEVINYNLENSKKDEKVLVVGGGNSAAEYGYYLADSNDVTLNYRQKQFSRLNPENEEILYRYEKNGKLKLKLGVDIDTLEDVDGKVKIVYTDGSSEIFDRIIYAIGGVLPADFLKSCGIELNERGRPIYDKNHETYTTGLYVAGDVAAHFAGSIASSLNHSYMIITHIKDKIYKKQF